MALPQWMKPGGGLPAAMRSTLITIAAVLTIGVLIQYGAVDLEEEQTLSIRFGAPVPEDDTVRFTLTARITNHTDEEVLLTAASPCKVFRWILLTTGGDFVQSRRDPPCTDIAVEQYLKASHYLEDSFTVTLKKNRLEGHEKLDLLARFWNVETRVPLPPLPVH